RTVCFEMCEKPRRSLQRHPGRGGSRYRVSQVPIEGGHREDLDDQNLESSPIDWRLARYAPQHAALRLDCPLRYKYELPPNPSARFCRRRSSFLHAIEKGFDLFIGGHLIFLQSSLNLSDLLRSELDIWTAIEKIEQQHRSRLLPLLWQLPYP